MANGKYGHESGAAGGSVVPGLFVPGRRPDLPGARTRPGEAALGIDRSGAGQAVHRRASPSHGSELAHLLEISGRCRYPDRDQMETAGGMESRRNSMADSAEAQRARRYSDLRLSR